jgi:putative flippase GtrA
MDFARKLFYHPIMNMINWAKRTYLNLEAGYPMLMKVGRFIISGGIAAFTNLALLYFFTDILRIWYLVSAVMSFIIAFGVSFLLQKHWTFRDVRKEGVHRQAAAYFAVAVVNLCLNTALLYGFVEYLSVHYMLSQAIASIIVAVEGYFAYQIFVFKDRPMDRVPEMIELP